MTTSRTDLKSNQTKQVSAGDLASAWRQSHKKIIRRAAQIPEALGDKDEVRRAGLRKLPSRKVQEKTEVGRVKKDALDHALEATFPASDPVSVTFKPSLYITPIVS